MKFTDTFIQKPVLATVVSLLILVAGLRAFGLLEVRQYPYTTNTKVTIRTDYYGAAADVVQGFITTPLEEEIASADGVDYLESTSVKGQSYITVYVRLNFPPNEALAQVLSKIQRVRYKLPAEALDPMVDVTVGESTASLYLAFYSDAMEQNQISDYLLRAVKPKLATLPGVQQAQIIGERRFAMRVWLKPQRLAAFGLTPSDVWNALGTQSLVSAAGQSKGAMVGVSLGATTDLHSPEEYRQLIIRRINGYTVRVQDVAEVELGAEDYDHSVVLKGKPGVFIGINVQPTANPLNVSKEVQAILPELRAQFPAGLNAIVVYDVSEFINASIHDVIKTLVEAVVIVIVVIFLFLGSFRAVIVPIVAIPLSVIGTLTLMLLMGFSVNLLTLLAMVLAIGLVVDDAIIVVENIQRHIEEGAKPLDAALHGTRELGGPIIAMTITLAAVYAPIGLMGGLTGILFTEFAFTLAGSVLISGVVALTLSPMLSSRVLSADPTKKGLAAFLDHIFEWLHRRYQSLLHHSLEYRPVTYVLAVVILGSCYFFYVTSQTELAPDEDQGVLFVQARGAPSATIDQMELWTSQIDKVAASVPEAEQYFNLNGMAPGGVTASINQGMAIVRFSPWDQRERTQMQIQPQYQHGVNQIAGLQTAVFSRPPLPGNTSGMPVYFAIQSVEQPARIYDVANQMLARAQKSGMFAYVESDLRYDRPEVSYVIDREKAAEVGLSMQQVAAELQAALANSYVNWFNVAGRAYQVRPQTVRDARQNPQQVLDYYVRASDGALVPLSTLIHVQYTVQPQELKHFGQLNSATIQGVPAPGVTMGDAIKFLQTTAKEILPVGYTYDYGGQSRQYVQEGQALMLTFVFALIVIYLVLSAQYESFRDPLIMLITVPMSISGALVFVTLGFTSINIYTQVGLVTLIGLISKHGILIVQFANELQHVQGMTKRDAVEHACGVRLRPILMTTAAMVAGVVPLITASGAGAMSRRALGIVVASGLSIGTLFTLFVVPAMYMLLGKDHRDPAQVHKDGDAPPASH